MSRLAPSFAGLLLLGSIAGCDLDPSADSGAEDLSFRCPCWNTNGLQNTFILTDESVAGVVRRDVEFPAFHKSAGSSDSLRLDLVEVPAVGGGWIPLAEVGADEDGLYGYACPDQACRRRVGGEFVGARFHFTHRTVVLGLRSDETKILRIEGWDGSEIPSYRFVYDEHPDPSAPEAQVCPGDASDNIATVYEDLDVDLNTGNLFDPKHHQTLMFGCQSAAIGKAEALGYGMYSGFDRETHEAAVRVIRADYCGDGDSWTLDNALIHVQDTLGVQPLEITENDELEAIWGMDGAICVYEPRLWWTYDATDVVCDGVPIPVCNATDDINTYPDALFLSKLYEAGFAP